MPARLLDIAPHGMKLSVPEPMMFEQQIDIKLECEKVGIQTCIPAEVRWFRSIDNQHAWMMGCRFIPNPSGVCPRMEFSQFPFSDRLPERGSEKGRVARASVCSCRPFRAWVVEGSLPGALPPAKYGLPLRGGEATVACDMGGLSTHVGDGPPWTSLTATTAERGDSVTSAGGAGRFPGRAFRRRIT